MRASIVRLAKQASERYLTPGAPTGIAGLTTAPAPRPTLINLYNDTLSSLKQLPASSAYRTSVEALTKHRLAILTAVKPDGYDAWLQRVSQKHPDAVAAAEKAGRVFAVDPVLRYDFDDRYTSWDGTNEDAANEEGPLVPGQTVYYPRQQAEQAQPVQESKQQPEIELEPSLTAEQVSEIEQKIGSGLIEEVIAVARGELELVSVMSENKVWEELEEKTPEGQWNYFERSPRHTAGEPR